jgi:hypothetical protein
MKLYIECILILFFFITLLGGAVEVAYNVADKRISKSYLWVVPSLFAAIFWFVHNLQI